MSLAQIHDSAFSAPGPASRYLANDDSSKIDTASRVCRCSRATCLNQFARP